MHADAEALLRRKRLLKFLDELILVLPRAVAVRRELRVAEGHRLSIQKFYKVLFTEDCSGTMRDTLSESSHTV